MAPPRRIGKYAVERVLGTGSFATVWLAYDERLDARVAVKVLAENWSFDDDVKRRFLEEARILWRAQHDRIVRVHLVDELDDGRPYFVMDYADRGTLHDRMRERFGRGEEFTPAEAVAMGREIAECLAVAHDVGIVHRDLKPSNILFRSPVQRRSRRGAEDATDLVVLADFGLAKRLEASARHTVLAGTPAYMAPEQADPKRALLIDERVDVFSASAIVYEMLTGQTPYPGRTIESVREAFRESIPPSPTDVRPEIPEALSAEIQRSLDLEPERRHRSALEWSDALAAALVVDGSSLVVSSIRDDEPATVRVARAVERLSVRLSGHALVGALVRADERLAVPPLLVVTGRPLANVEEIVAELAGLEGVRVRAIPPIDDADADVTAELPSLEADACLLVLPREPAAAGRLVRGLRGAAAARADGPIFALGLLGDPDASTTDAAVLRADDEVRSTLLTTLRLRWPDASGPGSDPGSVTSATAAAFGTEPASVGAVGIPEVAELVHRLLGPQSDRLRAAAAIGLIRRGLVTHADREAVTEVTDELEHLELDLPQLQELEILRDDVAGRLALAWPDRVDLRRVLLESTESGRLGVTHEAPRGDRAQAALRGAERWRRIADRAPFASRQRVLAVARLYDRMWSDLAG